MLRLAWKAVRHNPKRLVLTAISVTLGVALVAAIHTFTGSINRQFSEMIDEIYSGSDISVAQEGSFNFSAAVGDPFPESVADAVRAVDGVDRVEGGVGASPIILTPDGDVPPQTGAPNLFFNWIDDPEIGRMTVVDGRAVAYSGEATVDKSGMQRLGYKIGDMLQVATDDGVFQYRIVGATWFGKTNDLSGAVLVQLTLPDMQSLTHLEGQFQNLSIVVDEDADVDEVVADIKSVLPAGLDAVSTTDIREQQKQDLRDGLKYVDIFTLVFALIAIFVGSFIIANTFRIIVNQRTREIGLVRALGAQGKQVRLQILLEALIVAAVSTVIGIGLGYLLALLLATAASTGGLDLGIPGLPLAAIEWGIAVGFLVTLVSALLPAIHASQISPMEALRESATASRRPLGRRNIVGGSLAAAAVTTIAVGLYANVKQPGIWVGAGAAVLVLGVALLSAQVLTSLASGLRAALGAVFGVTGRLAVGNVRREPRRAGVTATALMIGVLLLAMVATLTETFKVTARDQVENQVVSDLIVSGDLFGGGGVPVNVSAAAQQEIAAVPGVALVSPIAVGSADVGDAAFSLQAIDPATAGDTFTYPTTPDVDRVGDGVYIAPRVQLLGYEVGDDIVVSGADGDVTLTVTGTYDREGDADLLVSLETGEEIDDDLLNYMALVNLDSDADLLETQTAIEDALEGFPLLQVTQPDQLAKSVSDLFDQILIIITVMLSASLVIAILGVANTLFLSVTERVREIGLLRAVGVRRRSVWSMITIESVVIAVFGALMGIVLGVGLGAALVLALQSFGFSDPVIPWAWLGVYAFLAIVAGIVAAIVPAWLASRLNILESIAVGE